MFQNPFKSAAYNRVALFLLGDSLYFADRLYVKMIGFIFCNFKEDIKTRQMQKRVNLFLLCFLFFTGITYAQLAKFAALPVVVSEMAAHDIYESETVGIAAIKSKQFARYQQLVTIATEEQLLALADQHASAVVRLYAYQALRERSITIPTAMQQKFKEDETSVQTLDGCIAQKLPLSKLAATPLSAKSNYRRTNFMQLQFASQ